MQSIITGYGSYLPKKIVTNDDLAKTLDTSNDWIIERTGIKQRHIAEKDELTSDIAVNAATDAMKVANVTPDDIDLVIIATTTPDNIFPATAAQVQAALGISNGCAFDIQAVCSGFVFALGTAHNYIQTGQSKCALVIGAEVLSRILDWQDRSTCILFGDGGGAVIVQAQEEKNRGILSTHLHTDGRYKSILQTTGGVGISGDIGVIQMTGKEVFKHAVEKLSACIEEGLGVNNLTTSDIDVLIPHQANARILQAVGKKLNLPEEKLVSTVAEHANTSAASIPLALVEAMEQGRINQGDLVVFASIGGGLSWGSCLVKW